MDEYHQVSQHLNPTENVMIKIEDSIVKQISTNHFSREYKNHSGGGADKEITLLSQVQLDSLD